MFKFVVNLFRRPKEGPLDIKKFNEKFVEGNEALALGTTEGLKTGLSCFMEALEVAGPITELLVPAIKSLRCALSHHERADTNGPWNRGLSGYGLNSWWNDHQDRDTALRKAWPMIAAINRVLKKIDPAFGWDY